MILPGKMMQVEKYCWKRPKSVELYGKLWIPDGSVNALVIMVHGIGEHSGCYDEWAERFTLQSVGFLAFDMRGHGHSSGIRGHASINAVKDDLRAIIKSMHKKFPGVPVVLFGHSLGGHIVLSYAIDKNVKVQGVIASSPWLKLVHPPSPLLIRLAGWASHIAPRLTVRTGIKSGQLSQNEAGTKSTKTDPLLHKKISIKLFTDLWMNSETILRNRHRLNIPLLLMHGTADPLTSYQASKSFTQNAGEYTSFKQWRGMHHDLLNDTGYEAVFQYVMKWLTKKVIENGTVQNSRKMYRVA
jgi:alpha-beta hydrolase superfamily lysophospholipase